MYRTCSSDFLGTQSTRGHSACKLLTNSTIHETVSSKLVLEFRGFDVNPSAPETCRREESELVSIMPVSSLVGRNSRESEFPY